MNNIYNTLGVITMVISYIILIRGLLKGKEKQNIATWLSWLMLDSVLALSLYYKDGNWKITALFVVGSSVVIWSIFKNALFKWSNIETVCILLVLASIVLWYNLGPEYAIVTSTVGIIFASIPLIVDSYKEPETVAVSTFVGYTIGNVFHTMAGKYWSIEERLYPMTCFIISLLVVLLGLRKPKTTQKSPTSNAC